MYVVGRQENNMDVSTVWYFGKHFVLFVNVLIYLLRLYLYWYYWYSIKKWFKSILDCIIISVLDITIQVIIWCGSIRSINGIIFKMIMNNDRLNIVSKHKFLITVLTLLLLSDFFCNYWFDYKYTFCPRYILFSNQIWRNEQIGIFEIFNFKWFRCKLLLLWQ